MQKVVRNYLGSPKTKKKRVINEIKKKLRCERKQKRGVSFLRLHVNFAASLVITKIIISIESCSNLY
jgi:hypothetical protein